MISPKIGLNDFGRQWRVIKSDVHAALERVGESGWYVLGHEVAAFEQELAVVSGTEQAVGCASGLDALELALRASGLREGDGVITTPLSAFATTLAIIRAGGRPLFVDVDENGLLDLALVEEVLAARSDVRFMLPVHLYGCPLDLASLRALSETYEITIVEDCAQALGASDRGTTVGGLGRAAGVSFYPTKNLGCMGDGGALLCNGEDVARSVRSMRDYGQTSKYSHEVFGLNSRLDELQAAILRSAMMPRLEEWTLRRREIASRYLSELQEIGLRTLQIPEGRQSVWHLFPVLPPDTLTRESLVTHLRVSGVASGLHYPFLIPDQPAMIGAHNFDVLTPLVQAERFANTVLSLPIHPFLTDEEVGWVIASCQAWAG